MTSHFKAIVARDVGGKRWHCTSTHQIPGIDAVMTSRLTRKRAWGDLAKLISADDLKSIYVIKPMPHVIELAKDLWDGKTQGRIVIDVNL